MYFACVTVQLSPLLSMPNRDPLVQPPSPEVSFGLTVFALPTNIYGQEMVAEMTSDPYPAGKHLVLVVHGKGESPDLVMKQVADLVNAPAKSLGYVIPVGVGFIEFGTNDVRVHPPRHPSLVKAIPENMLEDCARVLKEHFFTQVPV